jgi:hypothetical protein
LCARRDKGAWARGGLTRERAHTQAGAEVLAATIVGERAEAAGLRQEARALQMREEAKGAGAALAAAEAVVARAEAAGSRDAALEVVAEGAAALAALDLAPDPKASAGSLRGRLYAAVGPVSSSLRPSATGKPAARLGTVRVPTLFGGAKAGGAGAAEASPALAALAAAVLGFCAFLAYGVRPASSLGALCPCPWSHFIGRLRRGARARPARARGGLTWRVRFAGGPNQVEGLLMAVK